MSKNIENRFDAKNTKTIVIHDGRFHADDMMFAALATVAAEKNRNKIEIKRMGEPPLEYDESIVVGDVGLGIYDHHTGLDGQESLGIVGKDKERLPSSCELLYNEVKNMLFPGESETKKLFEAFIDIISHCDNTSDNNTFSDSINLFSPVDDDKTDDMAYMAIKYCKEIIKGFIEAHEKERGGKTWASPKVCNKIVPGVEHKKDERYFKATNQVKNRYKYVSFNGEQEIKLKAMDTYSLACNVLQQRKRQQWRAQMEENDQKQIDDIERREREDWPKALAEMQHLTIYLDKYIPYGKYVKELSAVFVVMPSQRGGYTVTPIRTNTGRYRVDPLLLKDCEGCTFIANDNRFVYFDTKENALNAAYMAGSAVEKYLSTYGFEAYRDIYGGCAKEYTGNLYQDLISEDIALNMYVRHEIHDVNNLTVDEYRLLQIAVFDNQYLIHSFCVHFDNDSETMCWKNDLNVVEVKSIGNRTLWTRNRKNKKWDLGLDVFLQTQRGREIWSIVYPRKD